MSLIEIARFHNTIGADLARARLEAAGIGAVLLDHNSAGAFGGAVMPSRLMVAESDAEEARTLLNE